MCVAQWRRGVGTGVVASAASRVPKAEVRWMQWWNRRFGEEVGGGDLGCPLVKRRHRQVGGRSAACG